jgi:hypothetical protein
MAAPGKKVYPLGLEAGRIYALTNGLPAATGLTAYDGVPIGGPTVLTLDSVERERVAHPGNNGIQQYDSLPGTGAFGGSLVGSRIDFDTIALVTGVKVFVEGETNSIARMSDTEQRSMPSFGLLCYTQSKQKSGSVRTFSSIVIPSTTLAPQNHGYQRERSDPTNYMLTPTIVTADITGRTLTVADDGCLTAPYMEKESFYRQHYAAFKWDGTGPVALFTSTLQAANTTDMIVYVNGVIRTTNITKAVTGVTFTVTQPALNDIVVIKYGLADAAVDID